MKKIITLIAIAFAFLPACSFAQKTAEWAPMSTFHSYMAATFHPAEEGNFAPLRGKVDSMYNAAKVWAAAPIPVTFKEVETKIELYNLVMKIGDIQSGVHSTGASDEDLFVMINEAHEIYHKITGECRKDEKK